MLERLRRFSKLPFAAQILFLRAAVLLPLVSLQLKWRGFQATRDGLLRSIERAHLAEPTQADKDRSAMIARMVRAAAHHGAGNPSCLEESLVLVRLLSSRGIASQLRIGVKRNQPKFEAHAWVECGGVALNEVDALHDHYAPFDAEFSSPPTAQS